MFDTKKAKPPKTPKAPNPPTTKQVGAKGMIWKTSGYGELVKSIERLGHISSKNSMPFAPKHSPLTSSREIISSLSEYRPQSGFGLHPVFAFNKDTGEMENTNAEDALPSAATREPNPSKLSPTAERIRQGNLGTDIPAGAVKYRAMKPPKPFREDVISQEIAGQGSMPPKNLNNEANLPFPTPSKIMKAFKSDQLKRDIKDTKKEALLAMVANFLEGTFEKDLHHGRINPAFSRFHTAKGLVKVSNSFLRSALHRSTGPTVRGSERSTRDLGAMAAHFALKAADPNKVNEATMKNHLEAIVGNFLTEKADSKTATKTATKTSTETSTKTSTDAYTQGNITVTGGAGAGATSVTISIPRGAGGDPARTAGDAKTTKPKTKESVDRLVANLLKESPDFGFSEDVTTGMIASIPMPMGQATDLCPCGSGKARSTCSCNTQATPMQSALARIAGEPQNRDIRMNPRTRRMISVWAGL